MNKKYINPKTGQKYRYYSRDGKGMDDVLEWAKLIEPRFYLSKEAYIKYKTVKQDQNWLGLYISTVYIGIDYNFSPNGNPLIFETMVFPNGKFHELEMDRYTTEKQALAGHMEMVKKWNNPLYVLWKIIDNHTWLWRYRIKRFFHKT